MIDSYSQRIDWDSIAKTAQPAMQPDRNGTWGKLVDHVRIVRDLEAALDWLLADGDIVWESVPKQLRKTLSDAALRISASHATPPETKP